MARLRTFAACALGLVLLGGCATKGPLRVHVDQQAGRAPPAPLARALPAHPRSENEWLQDLWLVGWVSGDPIDLAVLRTRCPSGRVAVTEAFTGLLPALTYQVYAPRTVAFRCLP